jgi:hypothetical protein
MKPLVTSKSYNFAQLKALVLLPEKEVFFSRAIYMLGTAFITSSGRQDK